MWYVAYYRVSTRQQGRSGLGLEAQRAMVRTYVCSSPGHIVAEFEDVGSARRKLRPQLQEALRLCRLTGATLVIARLDRLARSAALIAQLMDSGLDFVVADFPQATRFTIHILAAVAEYEWRITSDRVKAALAAAKARGVVLGGGRPPTPEQTKTALQAAHAMTRARAAARARDLAPVVWPMVARGMSRAAIAGELNRLGVPTLRRARWHATTVDTVLRATQAEFAMAPEIREALALGPLRLRAKRRDDELAEIAWSLRATGLSNQAIADEFSRLGVSTPRNGRWHCATIWKILHRTEPSFQRVSQNFTLKRAQTQRLRAEAKARELAPLIWSLRAEGKSTRQIAADLNERGVKPSRSRWGSTIVAKMLRQTAEEFGGKTALLKPPRPRSQLVQRKAWAMSLVPQIWKMLAEGMSKEAVVKEMNRLGVPSPRRRRWHLNSVDRVLALTSDATPPNPEATLAIKLGSKKFRRLRRARVFAPTIASLRVSGWTYDAIAAEFQRIGVPMTRRGAWRGSTVWKLHRLASNETGGHA